MFYKEGVKDRFESEGLQVMTLKTETLHFFFKLLYQESGLVLDDSKQYLIESRLEPIAIQEGFASIDALGYKLMQKTDVPLRQKVVEAMTTNETSFFRDQKPFECLRDEIFPELLKTKAAQKRIRIWCAACSTGQEPYSIAMLLCEMASAFEGWQIEIVASDISEPVLLKARSGRYSQHEVQRGLPTPFLLRYFEKSNGMWAIRDQLKKFVSFRKINLLSDFSSIDAMDVIFLRNILIYFDKKTKQGVLMRMTNILSPSGIFLIGASESLIGMETKLVFMGSKGRNYYKMGSHDQI